MSNNKALDALKRLVQATDDYWTPENIEANEKANMPASQEYVEAFEHAREVIAELSDNEIVTGHA